MRFLNRFWKIFLALALLSSMQSTLACTDFRIRAIDGTIIVARSMEFAVDLQSKLITSPRGRVFKTVTADGNSGMTWAAKYGYLYLDAYGSVTDGMNEHGLAIECLYLPGLAEYQTVPTGKNDQALPYMYMGDWVLSNFKTVAELRAAISNIYVFEQTIPSAGNQIFPLHYSFHDASGNSLVVEYIAGKLNVYDNPIGVCTNSPAFDWHITNLQNYVSLKPTNPKPVVEGGITFAATGQGGGMIGLPGDITPPSRFVKMVILNSVVMPVPDAVSALNLAQHILNNVDIPVGLAREPSNDNYTNEYTQWSVFKDLTHKKFYYKTYVDTSIKVVDLNRIDFSHHQLQMPIAGKQNVIDVTADLLESKAKNLI